jgi:chloramphenicol-sensitive protein RarD
VALVLCGIAVVVLAAGYGSPPYFALLIAVSWTVYGVSKKRAALPPLEGLAAETLVLLPVAVILLVVMQTGGSPSLGGASTLQLVLVPFTGIVTTVPLLLFAYSARRIPLAMLGWLQYWVPSINLVLGVAVYDEAMPAWRAAGFALVWIALALITVDGIRAARAEPATPPVETEPVPLEG